MGEQEPVVFLRVESHLLHEDDRGQLIGGDVRDQALEDLEACQGDRGEPENERGGHQREQPHRAQRPA